MGADGVTREVFAQEPTFQFRLTGVPSIRKSLASLAPWAPCFPSARLSLCLQSEVAAWSGHGGAQLLGLDRLC